MTKDARLKRRPEFTAVQNAGRRVGGKYVTLVGLSNTRGTDRLGIIASKRVGGATTRNRAKRRLRELFRREIGRGDRCLDIVAIARREIVDAPFALVETDFHAALLKLRGAR